MLALSAVFLWLAPPQFPGGYYRRDEIVPGSEAGEAFASRCVPLSDFNGDGVVEWAVGAPGFHQAAGRVVIFDGERAKPVREHRGTHPGSAFGSSIALIPDFDGDGQADYAVAAPGLTSEVAGEVFFFSGAESRLLARYSDQRPGGRFGQTLFLPGDWDGDGREDLGVAAPGWVSGERQGGRVQIFGLPDFRILEQKLGRHPGDGFGHAVAVLPPGDSNREVILAIGSPLARFEGQTPGAVFFWHRGQTGTLKRIVGEHPGEAFGSWLSLSPDWDGDGQGDWLIGACQAPGVAGPGCGALRLFSSGDGRLLFRMEGERPGEAMPSWVELVPDRDGDGLAEFAVGVENAGGPPRPRRGQLRIYGSLDGRVLHRLDGGHKESGFGASFGFAPASPSSASSWFWIGAPGDRLQQDGAATGSLQRWRLAPGMQSSGSSLSGKRGGQVRFDLDFGPESGGQPFQVFCSQELGHSPWRGILLPLRQDALFDACAAGRWPEFAYDWHGKLSPEGMAQVQLFLPPNGFPKALRDRLLWLSAAAGWQSDHPRASLPVPFFVEP
ncbi:MAG: hypothetical protein DWQ01_14705 [Planctomycetota bacterium]|nr:MAG: hypothetical protein DWQ01_14705 [Planctomycetota bacterium]